MINNLKIVKSTNECGNSFVGIKIKDNELIFYYPEAYQLSNEDNIKKDILKILCTINIARKKSQDMSNYNSKFNHDEDFPLFSYLWILNDYIENKRYVNKEIRYKKGYQGKISWSKTIRQIPYLINSSILFPFFISSENKQMDNILTEIYSYCVIKSVDEIGWYYNITSSDLDFCQNRFNKGKFLFILNEEISHTFDDKKRQRLFHMKNILTGLDDNNITSKEFTYGIDSYEYVFESMVDSMFSNIESKRNFFPDASWSLLINGDFDSSKLRPDTIMVKDEKVYIIDSKYYRYGTTFNPKDLPNTSSIEKQITYGEFAEKYGNDYKSVYNAFLIPYNKCCTNPIQEKYKLNKNFVFVGTAIANWPQDISKEYKKIATILIDLKFLTENYLKTNDSIVNDLIDKIENNIL